LSKEMRIRDVSFQTAQSSSINGIFNTANRNCV
jgi:hypothetical protein